MNEGLESCGNPTVGRYTHGCRCDKCKTLAVEYRKNKKFRNVAAEMVPLGNIPDRIEWLLKNGVRKATITKVSGFAVISTRKPNGKIRLETAKNFMIAWPTLKKLAEAATDAGIEV